MVIVGKRPKSMPYESPRRTLPFHKCWTSSIMNTVIWDTMNNIDTNDMQNERGSLKWFFVESAIIPREEVSALSVRWSN